jgi:hypothetical protein
LHCNYINLHATKKGPLWKFFPIGEKQNSSHYKAYCFGCVSHHAPTDLPLNADSNPDIPKVQNEKWFIDGEDSTNVIGKPFSEAI